MLDANWLVVQASANLADHLGLAAQAVLGRPIGELLSEAAVHGLRNRLALTRPGEGVTRLARCLLTDDQRPFDVALRHSEQAVTIELQASSDPAIGGDLVATVRAMIAGLGEQSPAAGFDVAARLLRALTGFDRVRVCRRTLYGDWQVVGQAARPGPTNASVDPPVAPVALDRLTLVADSDSPPMPLVGDPPFTADDGLAIILAAPSAALLAYLQSCASRALLTVPLVVGGRLWGLIDCQHAAPRSPPMAVQAATELFAQMWALRIEIAELRASTGQSPS